MRKYILPFLLGLACLTRLVAAPPPNLSPETAIELPAKRNASISRQNVAEAPFGMWYKWTAPSFGQVVINFSSGFVTFPDVYDETFFQVASSSSSSSTNGGNWETSVSFSGQLGKTYYIFVDHSGSFSNYNSDIFSFGISQSLGLLPDNMANAGTIPSHITKLDIEGSNVAASTEFNEPLHSDISNKQSVWLKWTSDGRRTVKLSTFASTIPTVIGAYKVNGMGDLVSFANLQKMASEDRRVAGWSASTHSESGFTAEAGETYYLALASRNNTAGALKLSFSVTPRAPDFVAAPRIVYAQNATLGSVQVNVVGDGEIDYECQRLPVGQKTWITLENSGAYSGTNSDTLLITPASFSMTGDQFRVVATDENGQTTSRPIKLIVTDLPPLSAMVRETVTFDLKNGATLAPGQTVVSSRLPLGLKLDKETGIVAGTVTARPGTYPVTYWTQVGRTKGPSNTVLFVIEPYPGELQGQFEALLEDPESPHLPAGKIEINVTATGAFTGRLTAKNAKVYALRGSFTLVDASNSVASLQIRSTPAFTLNLAINSAETLLVNLSETNNPSNTLGVSAAGVRVTKFAVGQAPDWKGNYTLALSQSSNLDSADPDRNAPSGTAYASATIKPDGSLTLRGKMPGGTPLTATLASASSLATADTFRLYINPYRVADAYVAGWLLLENPTKSVYRVLDGQDVYWNVPANPRARTYAAGFGPIGLNANMEAWRVPTFSVPLDTTLNLPNVPTSYTLTFDGAGLSAVTETFTVSTANRFTIANKQLRLSLNASTGAVTGTYRLPGLPARTAKLEGVLLRKDDPASSRAVLQGFFTLPDATTRLPVTGLLTGAPTD